MLSGRTIALVVALGCALQPLAGQQSWATYRDAQGRFSFEYPSAFGEPGPGTDDGFGGRAAAVRFSDLGGLGGEAVLTTGPVLVDVQALGGLYDALALQIFPDAMREQVVAARPPVTRESFCELLAVEDHLRSATDLDAAIRDAVREIDRMRNVDPRVVACRTDADTVVFHKEATYTTGAVSARQHVYGAVRFLEGPYSAFQIVRAGPAPPTNAGLETLERLVRSLVF